MTIKKGGKVVETLTTDQAVAALRSQNAPLSNRSASRLRQDLAALLAEKPEGYEFSFTYE
jgi:hypothetical protein